MPLPNPLNNLFYVCKYDNRSQNYKFLQTNKDDLKG